ncbi:MAG TPA: 50S ribosomal protein L11 methyltransferase [Verrucomicrobiae bacterium]|nr:50S ribosomal protein L11 methyltransferase [Verrucomicrobiae bacterium]
MRKSEDLWKISVATTLEAEDAVAEMLSQSFNSPASAYFDIEKQTSIVSVFSPKKNWREMRGELRDGLKRIKDCSLKTGSGRISISKVRREDWAESWKRHFKPMQFGDSLLVKPSWSRKQPRKKQAIVVLDPGLSFGTGQHATTSFCLGEIVRCRKIETAQSFLDIGTGSGILAIAAAKLNYKPVRAFDFDPEAVRVAKANARMNGVKIQIGRDDVTKLLLKPARGFDLVCANLISTLLMAERRKIAAQLNRDGSLVLAGILRTEFPEVQRAFENLGMKCVAARSEKEWRSGTFQFL